MPSVARPQAVFRIPPTALVAVALLALCVTPFAFAARGLEAVYAVPAGLAVWLLRERTTADSSGLVARRRDGRVHRISLVAEPMVDALEWMAFFGRFWEHQLDALERFLAAEAAEPHTQ